MTDRELATSLVIELTGIDPDGPDPSAGHAAAFVERMLADADFLALVTRDRDAVIALAVSLSTELLRAVTSHPVAVAA